MVGHQGGREEGCAMTDEQKNIVIIADSTGATAKRLMDAVLSQYAQAGLLYSLTATHQQVRDKATIDRILKDIPDDTLVLYSIVSEKLSKYLRGKLKEREILHLDVLEPMLKVMSKFLGVHPDYRPGILQIISDRYYKKIDAIGFTVEHDDGRGQLIEQADVVLLGLSRTCKTPVSMYLACNYGLKVANIPVVHENSSAVSSTCHSGGLSACSCVPKCSPMYARNEPARSPRPGPPGLTCLTTMTAGWSHWNIASVSNCFSRWYSPRLMSLAGQSRKSRWRFSNNWG
jgi:hypothetical protein